MKTSPTAAATPLSLRERQRQLTSAAILDAAFELFQQAGLKSATVDQIAVRAGINRATF